nr:Tx-949 [Heteropoda pingtungensis]
MKISIIMMLLLIAFSAAVPAERSIEQEALDLVAARNDRDCVMFWGYCQTSSDCCEGYVCRQNLCRTIFVGKQKK